MGQQQLLLIVLGVIIVGIAVFVGINIFVANAIEAKRNNVTNELVNLAAMAQQHYMRPLEYGGGNKKFTGWRIPPELVTTANGNYTATVNDDNVLIIGVGNEVVTGSDSIRVKITVWGNKYEVTILN